MREGQEKEREERVGSFHPSTSPPGACRAGSIFSQVKKEKGTQARRLPAGSHGIPRELVSRNQRERLIAAMAEVCAEKGYGAVSVADVTRQAAVSTASFYKQFADKRECLLESFEELSGRLLEEIERACASEGEPAARVRAGIHTAVSLLAADLPTARLLAVEILALGPEGVQRQHDAIEKLATMLQRAREPGSSPVSFPNAEWATVVAMTALVAKRVAEGESPTSSELEAVCTLL